MSPHSRFLHSTVGPLTCHRIQGDLSHPTLKSSSVAWPWIGQPESIYSLMKPVCWPPKIEDTTMESSCLLLGCRKVFWITEENIKAISSDRTEERDSCVFIAHGDANTPPLTDTGYPVAFQFSFRLMLNLPIASIPSRSLAPCQWPLLLTHGSS